MFKMFLKQQSSSGMHIVAAEIHIIYNVNTIGEGQRERNSEAREIYIIIDVRM